jgi:hypothetical protein
VVNGLVRYFKGFGGDGDGVYASNQIESGLIYDLSYSVRTMASWEMLY